VARSRKDRPGGGWALAVFGLPFAGVGMVMACLAGRTILKSTRMQAWERAPATILEAELMSHQGDDSTTYSVKATYRYSYEGRTYTGTRVGVHSGSDNIGSYHQRVYHALDAHRKTGRPFSCFVNPIAPSEAVLYPQCRWEMIGFQAVFALIFGIVGIGLLFAGVTAGKRLRRIAQQQAAAPDQPWLWNPDWAGERIPASNRQAMWVAVAMAVFWNTVSIPIAWWIILEETVGRGNLPALLVLVFPAIGIGLAVWAVISVFRRRKYGACELELATRPGVLGGRLAGVIHVPVHVRTDEGFRVDLTCVNRVTTGTGKNRSTSERVLYEDGLLIKRDLMEHDLERTVIPFLFGIPYAERATDSSDPDNTIEWRVSAQARTVGLDFATHFKVPVFMTDDSDETFTLDESALAAYTAPETPEDIARRESIILQPLPGGGLRLAFPALRQPGAALAIAVLFALWTGAIVLLLNLGAPVLFPIVFGLFDLFIFLGLLDLWLYKSCLEARHGVLEIRSGLPGMQRTWRIPSDDVSGLDVAREMRSGNRRFYSITIRTRGGKTVTAARRLSGKRQATLVAGMIERAAGIQAGEADPTFSRPRKIAMKI
jgi:hypothetical protein